MASPVGHALLGFALASGARALGYGGGRGRSGDPRESGSGVGGPAGLEGAGDTGNADTRSAVFGLAVFAALAPDLDFLPGLLSGTPNLYHPSVSHTLLAVPVFAAVVAAVAGLPKPDFRFGSFRVRELMAGSSAWAAWIGGLAYASHLLLDVTSGESGPGDGVPLLWPVSATPVHTPWSLFGKIHHGQADAGTTAFLLELLSTQNLGTVGLEVLVLLPTCLALEWWRRSRRHAGPAAPP